MSQQIAAQSQEIYAVIWGPRYGQLILEWARAAGSRQGSCLLYMDDPILGEMGPFTHTFELVAYAGSVIYSPGSNSVTGTIRLEIYGQPSEWLAGPISLVKSPANRFNQLTLSGGDWTNQSSTFTFGDCPLTRNPARPTVYQGAFQNTGGHYRSWQLSIVDTNDSNGNGIPDFSDDLPVVTPRRPLLTLLNATTQLLLRVSGEVGYTHLVQQAASLSATNWTPGPSLMLTNDPQVLALPLPSLTPAFWRVEAR